MTDEKTKPGKALLIERIEARREARAAGKVFTGYGVCPLCKEVDPFNTTRERRPNGDTRCGNCDGRTLTTDWKQPDALETSQPTPEAPPSSRPQDG